MFDSIVSLENLFAAWREFRRGKRNKPDVQAFERHAEDGLFALYEDLMTGGYRHGPYKQFHIFDPKHRVIHKACVRDRIVHHAVHRILSPFFDRSFVFDSYSCRVGKGTHAAVDRLVRFARKVSRNWTGPCWALKCDIRKFFDSIDHGTLLGILSRRIPCPKTMALLRTIIGSYEAVDEIAERERERAQGIPIGNLTSQLFANIYMDPFDHFAKETLHVRSYVRYTDDFVILHDNPIELVSLLPAIRCFLYERLFLALHPNKVTLGKVRQGIDFLGYVILPHHRVLRTKTRRRMFKRVNARNLSSYEGLLRHADTHALCRSLQSHVHRLDATR